MKRTNYRGYVIDTDNLGRPYIYNTEGPYSEDSDKLIVSASSLEEIKRIIDARIEYGVNISSL